MHFLRDISEVNYLIKHLPGQHDQSTHGRRFKIPGDTTSKVVKGPKVKKPKKEPEKIFEPSITDESILHGTLLSQQKETWKITPKEKSAIKDYTDYADGSMNGHLRGDFEGDNSVKEAVDTVQNALQKNTFKESFSVYRGITDSKGIRAEFYKNLIGKTFTDQAFFSTTIKQDKSFSGKCQFEIHIPKGTKGAYIYNQSANKAEREVLLPHGTKFKVKSVIPYTDPFSGSQKNRVVLEAIPHEEVKSLKHLPGQHDQSTHGRRFKIPGDESSKIVAGPKIKKPKVEKPKKVVVPDNYNPYSLSEPKPPLEDILPTKEYTQDVMDFLAKAYKNNTESNGMSINEYAKSLDDLAKSTVDKGKTFVQMRGSHLLKVLNDGRFKSQFEVNHSGGTMDRKFRDKWEQKMFSFGPYKDKKDRPIYGYLSEHKNGASSVSQYGEIAVRLKDSIRERTTVTASDSLQSLGSSLPRPINEADRLIFQTASYYDYVDPLKSYDKHGSPYTSVDNGSPYTEAQYHGGVSKDDIQEVVLPKSSDPKLLKSLTKNNIPYRFSDG